MFLKQLNGKWGWKKLRVIGVKVAVIQKTEMK